MRQWGYARRSCYSARAPATNPPLLSSPTDTAHSFSCTPIESSARYKTRRTWSKRRCWRVGCVNSSCLQIGTFRTTDLNFGTPQPNEFGDLLESRADQSKRYDGACGRRPVRAGSEEPRALVAPRAAALRAATRRLSRSFFLRWRSLRQRRVDRDPLPTARAYRRAPAALPQSTLC